MDKRVKAHAISSLRRGSYKWPPRWAAEKRSHIGRGEYLCECCGLIDKKDAMAMDHVQPVVDPEVGDVGLDSYAERLYVQEDGWQRLCHACHDAKTKIENKRRLEVNHKKLDKA